MVYKQVNRRTKVCYTWVFTEIFVLYTSKIDMYIKELDMYKEIIMYIKEFGTYTVREAHDRLRNSRKNEFGFIFKSGRSWKKSVSLLKCFEKILKVFWKMKYTYKKFEKDLSFESLKETSLKVLWKVLKTSRFRLDKNIIKRKHFWIFFDIFLK